ARRNRRHHRDVWFGANSFEGRRAGAAGPTKARKNWKKRKGQSEAPGRTDLSQERSGDVEVLRRGADAFAQDHHLGDVAWAPAAEVCSVLGRRSGNHGSGESRRV